MLKRLLNCNSKLGRRFDTNGAKMVLKSGYENAAEHWRILTLTEGVTGITNTKVIFAALRAIRYCQFQSNMSVGVLS
jgi:hypothetical protein